MNKESILNILITGTGGQGVLTLSNWLRELAAIKGFKCEGATFKGGAQRMGSIHTELRILTTKDSDAHFSSQIPIGAVDVLISMEPWEALRFANCCNATTKAIINSKEEKLYVERYLKTEVINPIENLERILTTPKIRDYSSLAQTELGDTKYTNYMMLKDSITNGYVPFSLEELNLIVKRI